MHVLSFEARSVRLPGYNGSIGILAGRQSLLTIMEPGIITIVDIADHQHIFGTTGGFCEMVNNEATLLCGSLFTSEDLDKEPESPDQPCYRGDPQIISENEKREYVVALMRKLFSGVSKP